MEIIIKAIDLLVEFYDPADDDLYTAKLTDTRRPRLTLSHIQKLRKSKDIERYEQLKHNKELPDIYGQPSETGM